MVLVRFGNAVTLTFCVWCVCVCVQEGNIQVFSVATKNGCLNIYDITSTGARVTPAAASNCTFDPLHRPWCVAAAIGVWCVLAFALTAPSLTYAAQVQGGSGDIEGWGSSVQ